MKKPNKKKRGLYFCIPIKRITETKKEYIVTADGNKAVIRVFSIS